MRLHQEVEEITLTVWSLVAVGTASEVCSLETLASAVLHSMISPALRSPLQLAPLPAHRVLVQWAKQL